MVLEDNKVKLLRFIYSRMKFVHDENENFDYMIKFKETIDELNGGKMEIYDVKKDHVEGSIVIQYDGGYDEDHMMKQVRNSYPEAKGRILAHIKGMIVIE